MRHTKLIIQRRTSQDQEKARLKEKDYLLTLTITKEPIYTDQPRKSGDILRTWKRREI